MILAGNGEAAGATTIDGEPIDLSCSSSAPTTVSSYCTKHAGFENPHLDFRRHTGVEHARWRGAGYVGPACRWLGLVLDRALAEDVTT